MLAGSIFACCTQLLLLQLDYPWANLLFFHNQTPDVCLPSGPAAPVLQLVEPPARQLHFESSAAGPEPLSVDVVDQHAPL